VLFRSGDEGLPFNRFTCAAAGSDGIVWFGSEKGAIRVENDTFYYRHSRRWVADDWIVDIAVDEKGTAWIASRTGVGTQSGKERFIYCLIIWPDITVLSNEVMASLF
jgi:ligand-binding sensor domain-containing protein